MSQTGRRLLLVAGLGLGIWQGYVHALYKPSRDRARQHAPKRAVLDDSHRLVRRTFFNGGADDAISEVLQTGDVVLLRRNALLEDPLTAAAIAASHEASRVQISATKEQRAKEAELKRRVRERTQRERRAHGARHTKRAAYAAGGGGAGAGDSGGWNTYDDCAFVFRSRTGLPHVAEPAGARLWKLTPYDEFITSSDASLIVVRKVAGERSEEEIKAARAFLQASLCESEEGSSPFFVPRSLHQLRAAVKRLWLGPSGRGRGDSSNDEGGSDGNGNGDENDDNNGEVDPSTLHSAAFVATVHQRMGIGIANGPPMRSCDVLPSDYASYAPIAGVFERDLFVRAK